MDRSKRREEHSGDGPVSDGRQEAGKASRGRAAARRRRFPLLRWPVPLLIVLCLLSVFLFAPFTAGIRSIAAMSIYDSFCEKTGLPSELGLNVQMPLGGMDFYPLMITYNDDRGMSSWLGQPVRFTVDYAVAGFGFLSDHSRFYDPGSSLYGAYAGAYYLQGLGRPVNMETALRIAAFDQRCLALPAIGLDREQAVFRASGMREDVQTTELSGLNWKRYDAAVITNGPEHRRISFQTGYVLFGDPPPPAAENYPLREMAGRIYVTYFGDKDLTVGLYILAKDASMLDQIDREVLSVSRLTWKTINNLQ